MKLVAAAALAAFVFADSAMAAERPRCGVPDYLLFGESPLKRVTDVVAAEKRLRIAVVGTGSSALAGPDGPPSAYPARLEAVLGQRLSGVEVKVITLLRTRLTAEDLAKGMDKLVADEKPNLVIWQTGTIDAIRRLDPDIFKSALEDGVERLHRGGADVILMNMQYSPRTEAVISVAAYADAIRWVGLERAVNVFDRQAIMRHWTELGTFDLMTATKSLDTAAKVHDCLGMMLADLIVEALSHNADSAKEPTKQ